MYVDLPPPNIEKFIELYLWFFQLATFGLVKISENMTQEIKKQIKEKLVKYLKIYRLLKDLKINYRLSQ